MTLLRTTLTLYVEAATDALKAFPRTLIALVFFLVSGMAMVLGASLVGSMGFAGGIMLGFLECALIGTYLSLVEIGLNRKRNVALEDVTGGFGTYFNRTIGVGFAMSLPALILSMVSPPLSMLWVLLTSVAFNSAIEGIYQGRSEDFMEILRNAWGFMQNNWPEWLGGHIPVLVPIAGLYTVLLGSAPIQLIASLLQIYSPYYDFFGLGSMAAGLLRSGPVGIGLSLLILVVNHGVILFRGALYAKLSRSSRRARAWKARAGG